MGTSLDHHLSDGTSESLARAKATLKDRLRQKMMQEALDELQDTDRVVDEAMDAFAAQEDVLKEAKEAFKQRLIDQVRRQALEEIAAGIDGSSLEANAEALTEAKEAFKERLLDQIHRQAIDEVGAEIAQEAIEGHAESKDLAKAGEAFKERLLDQIRRQALDEVGAEIAQEAIEGHAESKDLAKAGEAFKKRLLDQILRQALDEVGAEIDDASGALLERADGDALTEAKDAFKRRLLEHVLQQAIAEIDAEVDLDVEVVTGAVEENAALTLELSENVEKLHDGLGEPANDPDEPVVDARFWEFENISINEISNPSNEESRSEKEAQGEEDPGFFLSDPTEPGSDFEAASNGKPAEEPIAFAGDGAWQNADPVRAVDAYTADASTADASTAHASTADASTASVVYYLYGILSGAAVAQEGLPKEGIEPLYPIYPLNHERIQALVSKVSATEYGEEALQANLFDPMWKDQQAKAHEGFVDRFSREELFLPVPFCTIYESEAEVRTMLSEISYLEALEKIQGRSQWHLKLYRNIEVLHQQVVENSPAVQQLMADIKSKSKEGANSIKKKMVSTIREEEAAMTDNCTKDVHERLFVHAEDVELGTLDGKRNRENVELILDATYLVHKEQQEAFVEGVEQLIGEYATPGFEFSISGPAPPTLFSRLHPAENL
ncbi:MAG: GvpL/GvpF family gas vesicle protein [Bacteroidetes bacterium]|nr:GvpL/GvpF family gas vesicle protein [Bacteroidota bacterium]